MKKLLTWMLALTMAFTMIACGNAATEEAPAAETTEAPAAETTEASAAETAEAPVVEAPAADVEMQYITAEEMSGLLDSEDYLLIDVRKAADSTASHIPGSVIADMDAAKEGDFDAGVATMAPVIEGVDKNLVLVCYSGKSYAQASTNVLSALGYDMSKVYTLEGGFTNWSEVYPDLVEAE